jgi:hypothetical protein
VSAIYPSLFFVIKRFPNHRKALHHLYTSDELFQSLCVSYQQCSEAVRYWAYSNDANALERRREYGNLLLELESEILDCCSEGLNAE